MNVSVTVDTRKLEDAIKRYQSVSSKSMTDVMTKQGGKLGFNLNQALRSIAPEKGSIRAARIAALNAGGGIRIRESTRVNVFRKLGVSTRISDRKLGIGKKAKLKNGKGLNIQNLLVRAEINKRESGRGFLAASSRTPRQLKVGKTVSRSRFGPTVSNTVIRSGNGTARLAMTWGEDGKLSLAAARGLQGPKGQAAIAKAIDATTTDIMVYVNRKTGESLKESGLK